MNGVAGYLVFILPVLALGLVAQHLVKTTFARYAQVPVANGLSGAQVARAILDANGLQEVPVNETPGQLSDHYDPRGRTVNLSPDVFGGRSVSSAAVAAHEVGHAIQHSKAYVPLAIRSAMFPAVQFASRTWSLLLFGGIIFGLLGLAKVAVAVYAVVVLFQIVTLPVEFNASSRARKQLATLGLVAPDEATGVGKVLRAAASTYVAAALASLATLLYYLRYLQR